jgi:hypothetical protein
VVVDRKNVVLDRKNVVVDRKNVVVDRTGVGHKTDEQPSCSNVVFI